MYVYTSVKFMSILRKAGLKLHVHVHGCSYPSRLHESLHVNISDKSG